ncbi:DUF3806 domain-containing protein [Anatilimnocola floriformis]|uniref:DUF3806 domain-containing protein n=1 Tax=Anatilimnocola floriformis TaxID=2948575 RepID=UPI0020C2D300|nr:DUF3806 domain-containing protein [Anatilimnocola floriformis]
MLTRTLICSLLFAAVIFSGCSAQNQKITALTDADQTRLKEQRAVVEQHLRDEEAQEKYKTSAGKLEAIRTIVQDKIYKPDQTYELQCLGIVLGDAFVQDFGLEWVMVEDEYGRDPAVRKPDTTLVLYPLTMISKRIERGEQVDVFDLHRRTAAQVAKFKEKAK